MIHHQIAKAIGEIVWNNTQSCFQRFWNLHLNLGKMHLITLFFSLSEVSHHISVNWVGCFPKKSTQIGWDQLSHGWILPPQKLWIHSWLHWNKWHLGSQAAEGTPPAWWSSNMTWPNGRWAPAWWWWTCVFQAIYVQVSKRQLCCKWWRVKFEKNSPFFVECLNVSSCSFFIPTSFPNFLKHDLAGSNGRERFFCG